MKKLFKIHISFLMAAVLLVSCKGPENPESTNTKICHDCEHENFEGVPIANFMKDVARYNNTHVRNIRPDLASEGINPSRACWFSLDVIKRFVCLIESEAEKQNLSKDDLGIRFYYAVYPNRHTVDGNEYGKLHTLYMVPTMHQENENVDIGLLPQVYSDIDTLKTTHTLWDLSKIDSNIKVLILHTSSVKDIPSIGGRPPALIQNQGQLCPPTCPLSLNFLPVIDAAYSSENYSTIR
jgi:hypothetical protein